MDNLFKLWAIWNITVFILYGVDKWKAKTNQWRIPEKVLLGAAFLMGAPGAFFGFRFFRHKTKKKLFLVGLPLALAWNLGVLYFFKKMGAR